MSSMVERALAFYLEHSDVVDQHSEPLGQTHRVYSCPDCESTSVIRDGELVSLSSSSSFLDDDSLSIGRAASLHQSSLSAEVPESEAPNSGTPDSETPDPEALVTC
ncbi:MAG: hypothetical protein AAF889_01240 [Cyanobacteria bacterium P01_D01_bin.73]